MRFGNSRLTSQMETAAVFHRLNNRSSFLCSPCGSFFGFRWKHFQLYLLFLQRVECRLFSLLLLWELWRRHTWTRGTLINVSTIQRQRFWKVPVDLLLSSTSSSCRGLSGLGQRRRRLQLGPELRPTGRPGCWSAPPGSHCEPPEADVRSAAASPDKTSRLSAAPAAPRWPRPSDHLQTNTDGKQI